MNELVCERTRARARARLWAGGHSTRVMAVAWSVPARERDGRAGAGVDAAAGSGHRAHFHHAPHARSPGRRRARLAVQLLAGGGGGGGGGGGLSVLRARRPPYASLLKSRLRGYLTGNVTGLCHGRGCRPAGGRSPCTPPSCASRHTRPSHGRVV